MILPTQDYRRTQIVIPEKLHQGLDRVVYATVGRYQRRKRIGLTLMQTAEKITEMAHDHGAYLVDDSYQAMGPVKIDLHDSGVDFYTAGSEKWMCCPAMTGVFYIREGLWDDFEPSYRNYSNYHRGPAIDRQVSD